MATKFKVFNLKDSTAEQDISQLLAEVNVTKEGFIVSEGMLGVLYKEKDDMGADADQLRIYLSTELAGYQKQYAVQEGLVRSFDAVLKVFQTKMDEMLVRKQELKKELEDYDSKLDKALEKKVLDGKAHVGALEKRHKTASKADKEEILKAIHEANTMLKPLEEEWNAHKAEFDGGRKALADELDAIAVKRANFSSEVAQKKEQLGSAVLDRIEAKLKVQTFVKLLEDIKSGKIEEEMMSAL